MIVKLGDENEQVLRERARTLSKEEIKSQEVAQIKAKMLEALSKEKFGVAIAAPQVGEPLAFFLIRGESFAHQNKEEFDPSKHKSRFFFNPKMIKNSKKLRASDEGCLSVPGKYSYSVPRFEKVSIEYLDENAEKQVLNASGFLARIVQHEMDHLEGVLYTDKAEDLLDVDENMREI